MKCDKITALEAEEDGIVDAERLVIAVHLFRSAFWPEGTHNWVRETDIGRGDRREWPCFGEPRPATSALRLPREPQPPSSSLSGKREAADTGMAKTKVQPAEKHAKKPPKVGLSLFHSVSLKEKIGKMSDSELDNKLHAMMVSAEVRS